MLPIFQNMEATSGLALHSRKGGVCCAVPFLHGALERPCAAVCCASFVVVRSGEAHSGSGDFGSVPRFLPWAMWWCCETMASCAWQVATAV